jgi:DNA-binding response OmpR family regulator
MRIALLEDDIDQAALLRQWLSQAGHTVSHFADAEPFLRGIRHESFDLFILDWMLPKSSGMHVLKQMRGREPDGPPILFITAREDESSIVAALQAGADDYMIKPVRRSETLARIAALTRRRAGQQREPLQMAPYTFDLEEHSLLLNGQPVDLTEREFSLALFLFLRVGQIVSRQHLLEGVWGIDNASLKTRTVDTHVSRLRKKLGLGDSERWRLRSIYQHGYRLESTESMTLQE